MSKELPFDDDIMTLIMGLEGPEEPGQHGRKMVPAPEQDAVDLITQIKDLCEEFLLTVSKEEKPEKPEKKGDEEADDIELETESEEE